MNNLKLLHGMIFAISAIVLVYSGEQLQSSKTNEFHSYCMKMSSIFGSICITTMAISFLYGMKNEKYKNGRAREEQNMINKYYYEGNKLEQIDVKTVKEIEYLAKIIGVFSTLQDYQHIWNIRLTTISAISLVISVILFSIGVYSI